MTGEDTLKTSSISENASLWSNIAGGLKSAWNLVATPFRELNNLFDQAVDPSQSDTTVAISTNLRIDTLTNQVFLDTGAPLIQQNNDGVIVTAIPNKENPIMENMAYYKEPPSNVKDSPSFDADDYKGQLQLQALGYDLEVNLENGQKSEFRNDGADGIVGKVTRSAIIDFQVENNIEPTGEFDQETKEALTIAVNNQLELIDTPVIEHATRTNETSREFASARDYQVDSTSPRGIRNNNPGNIDFNESNDWQGQTGVESQGRFATFETPQHGIRAMAKLLQNYDSKYDFDTLDEIVNRYAPSSENDTSGYVDALARKTGLNPNETINLSDPATMKSLVTAMIEHENGMNPYSDDVINQGLQMAGLQVSTTLASGPTGPNPMS